MQLKQISDKLKNLNAQSISKLPDDDIYHLLKNEIGLSIGPMVKSTRALYEKLLIDSIKNLDNIDEYLSNYTKNGDEQKQSIEYTKTMDSGHGQSMNNSSAELNNIHDLSSVHHTNNNQLESDQNTLDYKDNSRQSTAQTASLSNRSNVSNKSTISDQSNHSNESNQSDMSRNTNKSSVQFEESDQSKSNNLNVNLMQSSFTSPIPTIKITSDHLETNLDSKWPTANSQNDQTDTRCSTPIERHNILKQTIDSQIANTFEPYNHQRYVVPRLQSHSNERPEIGVGAVGSKSTNAIPRNQLNNPFKNVNLNRNVFKDYASGLQRNQINRPVAVELNRNHEPALQSTTTIRSDCQSNPIILPNKSNKQTNPLSTLQFSDNEDANDDYGTAYEYKITRTNQTVRPRLTGRLSRIPSTRSEYMKRGPPNYQTNHPPEKDSLKWCNTLIIFVLALFIFSIVLSLTTYL